MKLSKGASSDALALTTIKLVTISLGFINTRLMSQYLSTYEYGTYSQILLIVSTAASLTILGMMDGVNYFYCSEQNLMMREAYIATLFAMQCVVNVVVGGFIIACSGIIVTSLGNEAVRRLLIFAAILPLMQNLLGMLQVLMVSLGKAKVIAVRNLLVSLIRLVAVLVVVFLIPNVAVILTVTLILDVIQILIFIRIMKKNQCPIRFGSVDCRLGRRILSYCIPMAVFTAVNALNRDCDKYLIALLTDTQTLAVYTNASKVLPFDIIMASFCTVLLPEITRLVTERKNDEAVFLYKLFLEIAYISTGMLCVAALCAAPQLMELLYSEKYISGLPVFCIYILVDLIRFTNITLILSAAGKTKKLMYLSFLSFAGNAALNLVFFFAFGVEGPAVATLLVTLSVGVVMLWMSGKELNAGLSKLFDLKYLSLLATESVAAILVFSLLRRLLENVGVHYFAVLLLIGSLCAGSLLLANGKRLLQNLKLVNQISGKRT